MPWVLVDQWETSRDIRKVNALVCITKIFERCGWWYGSNRCQKYGWMTNMKSGMVDRTIDFWGINMRLQPLQFCGELGLIN